MTDENMAADMLPRDNQGNASVALMPRSADIVAGTFADLLRRLQEPPQDRQTLGKVEYDAEFFLAVATAMVYDFMAMGEEDQLSRLSLKLDQAASEQIPAADFWSLPKELQFAYWSSIMIYMIRTYLNQFDFCRLNARLQGVARDHWRQLLLWAYQSNSFCLNRQSATISSPLGDDSDLAKDAVAGLLQAGLAEKRSCGSAFLNYHGMVLAAHLLEQNKPKGE